MFIVPFAICLLMILATILGKQMSSYQVSTELKNAMNAMMILQTRHACYDIAHRTNFLPYDLVAAFGIHFVAPHGACFNIADTMGNHV